VCVLYICISRECLSSIFVSLSLVSIRPLYLYLSVSVLCTRFSVVYALCTHNSRLCLPSVLLSLVFVCHMDLYLCLSSVLHFVCVYPTCLFFLSVCPLYVSRVLVLCFCKYFVSVLCISLSCKSVPVLFVWLLDFQAFFFSFVCVSVCVMCPCPSIPLPHTILVFHGLRRTIFRPSTPIQL
jgi:hypothetical protein